MNKTVVLSLLGFALLTGAFILFNLFQPPAAGQTPKITPSPTADTSSTPPTSLRYSIFDPETFTDTANTRRVLFFYASWCPICISADQNFNLNQSKIPADVTLIRVNYNDPDTDSDEKSLAQKYNITYQHTFVQIDQDGQEITKWNGGQIKELLANIK